jgi:hypothetical protein
MEAVDGTLQSINSPNRANFHYLLECASPQQLDALAVVGALSPPPGKNSGEPLGTLKAMPSDSHSRHFAVLAVAVN